jgi:hypothetical protein
MTRYRVELAQTVIERATVWIEANSQDEAEALALAESAINLADWRFAESFGDIEVLDIQKVITTEKAHGDQNWIPHPPIVGGGVALASLAVLGIPTKRPQ